MARILIVDDDKGIAELLQKLLTRKGYEVFALQSSAEAIKLTGNFIPDLLITDIVMPDIGGLELIRLMRTQFPKLPVIAISGGALIGPGTYLSMAKQLGVNETFDKPFDLRNLTDAVDRLIAAQ